MGLRPRLTNLKPNQHEKEGLFNGTRQDFNFYSVQKYRDLLLMAEATDRQTDRPTDREEFF